MTARKQKPMNQMMEGFEGAATFETMVRVTQTRSEPRAFRCKPGTFEWRYGRQTADSALYHAGIKFADLWERAGTASASSPDLAGAMGSGQWKGIPDARTIAMDAIKMVRRDLGKWQMARLVDYCVMGTSASDMASKYNADERGMSHVLMEDLRDCARAFGYL